MQQAFIHKLEALYGAAGDERGLFFCDPTHPLYNNLNGYKWQHKGRSHTQAALSNEGRKRLTILSALDARKLETTTLFTEDNCDREMMLIFLEQLRESNPHYKHIDLVLGNAAYHRAKEVQQKAAELNIVLHYLPPYCPNLNLIERLWKFLKKTVFENRYYPTKAEWMNACESLFRNWDQYLDKLKSLLTFKFNIL